MSKIVRRFSLAAFLAVVVAGLVFFWPSRLDDSAWRAAQSFCDSLVVGGSANGLAARAKQAGADFWTWDPDETGTTRHVAWFGGFLANQHACNILETSGVLKARYPEEHRW